MPRIMWTLRLVSGGLKSQGGLFILAFFKRRQKSFGFRDISRSVADHNLFALVLMWSFGSKQLSRNLK